MLSWASRELRWGGQKKRKVCLCGRKNWLDVGSPVRAYSCRIKAQKQHQCRGAAESNIRNLNHSPSLIVMEQPGEGQDTGVQVRVGNLAINGGQARLEVWQRVHAEAVVKMGAGMILILGEFFFSPGTNHFLPIDWEDPSRPFQHHNAWQHATIIAFFLLSALVDLTSQVWLAQLSMKLEWAATALSLVVIVLEMVALPEHRNALEF
uniref:Uncharacterized protein n=1 Tax=Rangifer tarandus platyrhynchus TaxID=3082113 RepID=A0ACB0FAA9_RANTA|nr:unnamed protein product [Rangifer tarandus platyrhynchus]